MRLQKSFLLSAFTALLAPAALAGASKDTAEVSFIDRNGKQVGEATLTQTADGVKVVVETSGLPTGGHGLHIHSQGACEPPAFKSAGGHYQPGNRSHGFLDSDGPHAGDLPTLEVRGDGKTNYQHTTNRVALTKESLLKPGGTSLVIHAQPDDYLTDTGGGSGDRIACGVISSGADPKIER